MAFQAGQGDPPSHEYDTRKETQQIRRPDVYMLLKCGDCVGVILGVVRMLR